ncbi:hypothetical protein, partial [Pseudarthrobacter sp. NKDBFgelt]|uniref:hypothetical protein n=1 Tax=Pseudarthrobacter sp. NKDBFgelt TaxID=3384443 RepID=UPI0038D49CE1
MALGAAAYFLFIALTMLSAAYHEYNVGIEEYAKYEREREGYKRKSADEVISKCPVADAGGLIEPECLKKALNSFIEKDTSDKDLQAQQDMAKWAFFTLIVGIGGVIISIGGVIGLFMSLHQTKRSINISETVGQAQVRPYLSVEFD